MDSSLPKRGEAEQRIISRMKQSETILTMKTLKGRRQLEREASETIWVRFDRLQRSVSPLRRGKRISRGIHYGRGT